MDPAYFRNIKAHRVQIDTLNLIRLRESDYVSILEGHEILLNKAQHSLLYVVEILLSRGFGPSRKLDESVQPRVLEIMLQTISKSRLNVFSPFAENGVLVIECLPFISAF